MFGGQNDGIRNFLLLQNDSRGTYMLKTLYHVLLISQLCDMSYRKIDNSAKVRLVTTLELT